MSDPKSKPKRGRPQTLNAEKALKVAMDAYWKSDPTDVSINAICEMAGASKPAIYRQFGNEDGLMLAVLNHYVEQVIPTLFKPLTDDAPLQDTLNAVIQFCSQDPTMETGCVFCKMRAGKHRLGPQTQQRVNEIYSAAIDAFSSYLDKCRHSGKWESEQPTDLMARYLVEQISLAFTQRAAGESS
ncbi:MAG: TetR/AcrR family transcriptional regulator, partial [Burkholderiaceae bacterium]